MLKNFDKAKDYQSKDERDDVADGNKLKGFSDSFI